MIYFVYASSSAKIKALKETYLGGERSPVEDVYPVPHGLLLQAASNEEDYGKITQIAQDILGKPEKGGHLVVPLPADYYFRSFGPELEAWAARCEKADVEDGIDLSVTAYEELLDIEPQKERLGQLLSEETLRETFRKSGAALAQVPSNILLWGASGAGKRSFAFSAAALLCERTGRTNQYFDVRSIKVLSGYQTVEAVNAIYKMAPDGILIIDRIDLLLEKETEEGNALVGLLHEAVRMPDAPRLLATASGKAFGAYARSADLFQRAFPNRIDFPAPALTTLVDVFKRKAKDAGLVCDPGVRGRVASYLKLAKTAKKDAFTNGHEVDFLLSRVLAKMAARLTAEGKDVASGADIETMKCMKAEDVPSFTAVLKAQRPALSSSTQANKILHFPIRKPK